MLDQFKKNNHKNKIKILVSILVFSMIMIGLFGYLLYLDIKNRPLVEYPRYSLSTTEWTSVGVILTVNTEEGKLASYSIDGGKNYQDSNIFEITSNSEIYLMVKDIHGKTSKMIPISISNVDKESPIITFEATTTVQLGSNFSLRNGVQAYDEGSGLNSNYVVVPEVIDTSVIGEYTVKYTAFDKVGNYTEKERKIIVSDIQGRTYYRYRTATIENYQCEPYMCNCVVAESATLTQTCPSGYTFNQPNQCCQTCYQTCQKMNWGEWSDWSQEKVTATNTREVETKIE